MPPVLHVALAELPRGREQELLAQQLRPDDAERHHVLELVAEAEGAAGLVVAGARPEAAGQRLVQQPAVHHHVERVVGRPHLHGAEQLVPALAHLGAALALAASGEQ